MSDNKKMNKNEVMELLLKQVSELTAKVQQLTEERAAAPAAKTQHKKGQPRPDMYYIIKAYPTEKYAPQCLRVMRCLAACAPEGGKMSEVEVYNALMGPDSKLGPWKYRQDPFYIFKYYKNPMIDGNYLLGPIQG